MIIICIDCGQDRPNASGGRCVTCASRHWRRRNPGRDAARHKAYDRERAQSWARRVRTGGDGKERKVLSVAHLMDLQDNNPRCMCCREVLDYSLGAAGMNAAQLDRVIPSLGYVAGNVAVICRRCNAPKSDNTPESLRDILAYIERHAPTATATAAPTTTADPTDRTAAAVAHMRWVESLN